MSAERRKTGQEAKPNHSQSDARIADVIRAYQEIIRRYPHTEIAADSALSLSGVYQYLGQFDKAAEMAEQTAREFAGTRAGAKATFNAGLIHAGARHDPSEAVKWFARIPKPAKPPGAPYDEEDKLYLSAQQQLIKCELMLGSDAKAKERADRLKQVFPQFAAELERSYQFEVDSVHPPKSIPAKPSAAKGIVTRRIVLVLGTLAVLVLVTIYLNRRKTKGATS